jgi:transcriptional regulator with XRE-family HTH domain
MFAMTYKMTPVVIMGGVDFGQILRTLRAAAGMTQTQAAEAQHCVPALVSMRETGRRQMYLPDAVRVLDSYGYVLVAMSAGDADRLTAQVGALSKPGPD